MNDLQTLVATILGALLVLVAVWLIAVRRDPARNSAKFLGIELDLSTPGLAVLVAGCALVVAPAFVPHRPGGLPSFGWPGGGSAPGAGERPIVLQQQTVLTSEEEPNDSVGSANLIELGQTIAGSLVAAENAADYFALASAPETRGAKRIIVRTRGPAAGCCVNLNVWNGKEELLAQGHTIIGGTISEPAQPADAYLIRIANDAGGYDVMNYELVIVQDQ
jgi:hypothetical protein